MDIKNFEPIDFSNENESKYSITIYREKRDFEFEEDNLDINISLEDFSRKIYDNYDDILKQNPYLAELIDNNSLKYKLDFEKIDAKEVRSILLSLLVLMYGYYYLNFSLNF